MTGTITTTAAEMIAGIEQTVAPIFERMTAPRHLSRLPGPSVPA